MSNWVELDDNHDAPALRIAQASFNWYKYQKVNYSSNEIDHFRSK